MIAYLSGMMLCKAEILNFRTNMLMFNTYYYEEQEKIFAIFTNNLNEKILFSMHPNNNPSYTINYNQEEVSWDQIDQKTQNRIKRSIYETENAEDFATQMYFYIHTQMLIWTTFHPDLSIIMGEEMKEYQGEYEKYAKKLQERVESIPEWIKDYEITDKLEIPKEKEFSLESQDCEIKRLENTYEITCNQTGTIIVKETMEETLVQYSNGEEHYLEGFSPREWKIQITKKDPPLQEEPSVPETPEIPKETEEPTIPNIPFIPETTPEKENSYYVLKNVPNTLEKSKGKRFGVLLLSCILFFKKRS